MIRIDTNGSRICMESRNEREYLMALIDEAERIISSDPLGEDMAPVSYTLQERKNEEAVKEDSLAELYAEAASCHACSGYQCRCGAVPMIAKRNPKVLFIIPFPEGGTVLSPSSLPVFRAWWHDSLLLEEGEWALTTVIKCPVGRFSAEAAGSCRAFLRREMSEMDPSAMVIMGHEAAAYILGRDLPMEGFRSERFVVNHIPSYVTYTPADYAADPSLRRAIWNDMLFIRKAIGTEGRRR